MVRNKTAVINKIIEWSHENTSIVLSKLPRIYDREKID